MRTAKRLLMVALSAVAMLGFLLAIASLSFGRLGGVAFYLAVVIVCVAVVTRLWRRERAMRRADEALLPPERRPSRRSPRQPITFRLTESVVTFAAWYVAVLVVDRIVTGTTTIFTLAAIAAFAAFMLATITIAGRHMAFRLTAEDTKES